jgi:hypothetical protein
MVQVVKKSGEIEPLAEEKIKSCVARVGGSYELSEKICREILKTLPQKISSAHLYKKVFERLKRENPIFPLKLNLKKAIFDLGPSGFPFEKYFAKLLQYFGYQTEINLIMEGKCVKHEIDVLAVKTRIDTDWTRIDADKKYLIECKFRQHWGTKCDIQIPLYVSARVVDINERSGENYIPWLATNTRLSLDAIDFSECKKIKVSSWRYPFDDSLERMIEASKCYPITILISGNTQIYQKLIRENIILIEDLLKFDKNYIQRVISLPLRIVNSLFQEAKMLIE